MAEGSLDRKISIVLVGKEPGMPEAKESSDQSRKRHIEEMKDKLRRHLGNPESLYLSEFRSLKEEEEFLEHILFMEGAEEQPLFDQLKKAGVQLPHPEDMDGAQLHTKLWEVINSMALLGHYLSSTDHLSDKQLYDVLWHKILREPTPICPDNSKASYHIDILGECSEEDLALRLKYYADEDERLHWAEEFPEDTVPPHEPLQYDRDRHLPAPDYWS
jgi:hypothetical protein